MIVRKKPKPGQERAEHSIGSASGRCPNAKRKKNTRTRKKKENPPREQDSKKLAEGIHNQKMSDQDLKGGMYLKNRGRVKKGEGQKEE